MMTHKVIGSHFVLALAILAACPKLSLAADRVFSGPQPNEPTTPFKVAVVTGVGDGSERDPIAENKGAPTALVFIHTVERSLVPLLRVIDQYGALRKDLLKTEVIFLVADRVAGEQRLKATANSLRLQSRVGLSLDGAEGPGNYGLNKECMMTIVMAKDNKVTTNFALVQPGIADAPKVIEALAKLSGDANPPTVESLSQRPGERPGMARGNERMAPGSAEVPRRQGEPLDLSKLDLNSEAGLRDAVKMLAREVNALRQEVAELRGGKAPAVAEKAKEPFPGDVPTDEKLVGLLRQFIRPTNDDATVDRVLGEVETYIKDNRDLTKQALDGWTRVLHFGDRYGTPHARKKGAEFLEKLKK